MPRPITRGPVLALVLCSAAGCGSDLRSLVDEAGCNRLKDGPASMAVATASSMLAPKVHDDHKRYDVTLVDIEGGKGGFVSFTANGNADYVFFLGAPVTLTVLDQALREITFESTAGSSPSCSEIKGRHMAPLLVGPHLLKFGPGRDAMASIVIEPVAH